jgi:hypothetical protein
VRKADPAFLSPLAGRYASDRDRAACPPLQRLGLAVQKLDNGGSDGAETGNADAQGRRHEKSARGVSTWEESKAAAGLLPDFQGTIKVRHGTGRWNSGRKTKLAPSL